MLNNEQLTPILKRILDQSQPKPDNLKTAYYAGGTLCIDHDDTCTMCEINGGIVHNFITDEEIELTQENHQLLFEIYKKTKGETEYYKECYNKFISKPVQY